MAGPGVAIAVQLRPINSTTAAAVNAVLHFFLSGQLNGFSGWFAHSCRLSLRSFGGDFGGDEDPEENPELSRVLGKPESSLGEFGADVFGRSNIMPLTGLKSVNSAPSCACARANSRWSLARDNSHVGCDAINAELFYDFDR